MRGFDEADSLNCAGTEMAERRFWFRKSICIWGVRAMRIQFAWACAGLMMEASRSRSSLRERTSRPRKPQTRKSDESAGWKNQGGMAGDQGQGPESVWRSVDRGFRWRGGRCPGERYKWKALSELQQSSVAEFTLSFLKVTPLCPDAAFARYEVLSSFREVRVPFEKYWWAKSG